MGLFSWWKRKPVPGPDLDRKATWIRDQLEERSKARDVVALVDACATLAGHGTMVFGMVVPSELPARDSLLDHGLAAIREHLATLPDHQCERVFGVIARAELPIDVTARRDALTRSRAAAADTMTSWIRAQIAERASAGDVLALAEACEMLGPAGTMVFGMVVPRDLAARGALRDECLAAIRPHIPSLTDAQCARLLPIVRRAGLPLDVADRSAELADRRRVERATLIEAAQDTEPHNPELEAALAANPDDPDTLLVLADWLQARHHPRGELIALQLRAESDPAVQPAAAAVLSAHAAVLLGPLEPHQQLHDGTECDAFVWRRGYIHRAHLSVDRNADSSSDDSVAEILQLLLAHPSGRHLAELAFGINGESYDATLDDVIEILAAHAPATLRALHLGDFVYGEQADMSSYEVGDLARLWRGVPRLRHLIVQGGAFELGEIDLPALERAELRTGGLSGECARAITTARWPNLQFLEVWYGDPDYGATATLDDVLPLLARRDLPALVHLGLKNAAFTDEICGALAHAALAPQLRVLDLSMGTMSDAGASSLVSAAAAFPALRHLDVSRNFLSDDAIALLGQTFPTVLADDQDEADAAEDRYPSVGE